MTPESLVATRETCMRLKEKGFPQTTFFCWGLADDADADSDDANEYQIFWDEGRFPNLVWESSMVAAPTLAEVLEQLPIASRIARGTSTKFVASALVNGEPDAVASRNPAEAAALLWEKVKG